MPGSARRHVAIIGAGPAGLMAAEVLARNGHLVTVYDHMASPARKFLMAGRGGLNVTHSEPIDIFLSRYRPLPAPLKHAIEAFPPEALRAWAEGLGEPLFVGSSGRVFPRSLKASPLLRAWLRRLDGLGVKLETRQTWRGWTKTGALLFEHAGGAHSEASADATLLALGGASWPRLGSDGGWTRILEANGVAVTPLAPANTGVLVPWSQHLRERFAGAPLKRIAVRFNGNEQRGEAVVTQTGLEGGTIYALSSHLREALAKDAPVAISLDLKPDETLAALAARLSAPRGKASLASFLRKRLALAPAAIALLREAAPGGAGGALPEQPEDLAAHIKSVTIQVTGLAGLERAISTAGGVSFSAVDEHLMLKARPGVFVAGEMLDWEAPTGGYLLQASFSTAVAAAEGLSRWLAGTIEKDNVPAHPHLV